MVFNQKKNVTAKNGVLNQQKNVTAKNVTAKKMLPNNFFCQKRYSSVQKNGVLTKKMVF